MKSKIILGGLLLSTAALVSLQSPQITSAESLTNSAEIIVPLSLKVKAHYTNGLALEAGKEVRLRNLTDGSTEVLKKQVDANGEVVFTEQDGMKKEVNYGIETDGVRNGYTVRYDLGGEKEKDITVNLPGVTKNTNSKQSSDSKASDKQANSNHPSIFFNNKKKLSNLNYNNSNEKRKLTNQEKKKEDNRNKNTMELPKTGEKYNGLPMYLGLFTVIVSIIGLKKKNFNMGSITIYLIQFEQFKLWKSIKRTF